MRPSRVYFLVRQALIATIASAALILAVKFWPEPAGVVGLGVNGAAHKIGGRDAVFHYILEKDDEGLRGCSDRGLI